VQTKENWKVLYGNVFNNLYIDKYTPTQKNLLYLSSTILFSKFTMHFDKLLSSSGYLKKEAKRGNVFNL